MSIFRSLLLLLICLKLNAQIQTSITQINGRSVNYFDALDEDSVFYTSMFKVAQPVDHNNIFEYDKNMTLLDSIDVNPQNHSDFHLTTLFRFNGYNYGLASNLRFKTSVHKITSSNVDSSSFGIDSLQRSYPVRTWNIKSNTLRTLLYESEANSVFVKKSKIIDLDSNFNITDYHSFNFDSIDRRSNVIVTAANFINDSVWHIFTQRPNGALHHYNVDEKLVDSSQYLWGEIRKCYPVNSNEYLALGIVSWSPTVLGLPYTGMNALGFYRISHSGQLLDTAYFLNIDNNAPGTLDFSNEDMNVPAVVIYDTNTIYLAAESSYRSHLSGSQQEGYIFVIKTDSRGNEHWRYTWGGTYKLSFVRGLVSTPDSGCIVVGNYAYEYPQTLKTAMILIKLGPDGTISNVEFDAPENLVQFYPNPLRDELRYTYLPEASGPYKLEIINMSGQPVTEIQLNRSQKAIPLQLSSGFYLYHLKDGNGKVQQVGKLVVE